jgi:hypothetical protein
MHEADVRGAARVFEESDTDSGRSTSSSFQARTFVAALHRDDVVGFFDRLSAMVTSPINHQDPTGLLVSRLTAKISAPISQNDGSVFHGWRLTVIPSTIGIEHRRTERPCHQQHSEKP